MKLEHRETREDLRTFLEYAKHRHRTSQLLMISDNDNHKGLEQIKQDLKVSPR